MATRPAVVPVAHHHWVKIDKKAATTQKKVDPWSITVSRVGKDEVEWFSTANESYTIRFAPGDSPFPSETFSVPNGGSTCSGPARFDASEKAYKYDVLDSKNQVVVDPEIVIKN
jgi:hypothetical protein